MSDPKTAPAPEPDHIHLRDHIVAVEVGAFADERDRQQRLRFDVDAALSRPARGVEDDVDRIVSYDVLVEAVAGALSDRRFDLLEAIAEGVATRVLAHGGVASVRVTVEKLDRVPGALGVTITRQGGADGAPRNPAPVAVHAPGAWPDAVDGAAILVPDVPGLPLPDAGPREQLLLLALDQAAWALAARRGLDVAATRTELEAAAAAGRPVVWAPARMVREAADLDPADRTEPQALTRWLTRRLG